jgi:hypothetical protein
MILGVAHAHNDQMATVEKFITKCLLIEDHNSQYHECVQRPIFKMINHE